jgi:hypothetical protein
VGRRKVAKLADIEQSRTPPARASEILDNNLFYQAKKVLSGNGRMADLALETWKDAMGGCLKSRQMLWDFAAADRERHPDERPSPTTTVNVQNNTIGQAIFLGKDGVQIGEQDLLRNAVLVIAETGPQTLDALARAFHLLHGQIADALRKSDWFELKGDGFHLSQKAYREVMEPLKPMLGAPVG